MKTNKLCSIGAAICLVGFMTPNLLAKETDPQLLKEAKVTQAAAEKTAMAKVPNGKVESSELEKEHGKLVWSFDISRPGTKTITEVQVDAKTGQIAAVEEENEKDQAREKTADEKEKQ